MMFDMMRIHIIEVMLISLKTRQAATHGDFKYDRHMVMERILLKDQIKALEKELSELMK